MIRWSDLSTRPQCQSLFEPQSDRSWSVQTTDGRVLTRLVRALPPTIPGDALSIHLRPDGGMYWGGVEGRRPRLTVDLQVCQSQEAWVGHGAALEKITLGGCPMEDPRLFLPTQASRTFFAGRPGRAIVRVKAPLFPGGQWRSVTIKYLPPGSVPVAQRAPAPSVKGPDTSEILAKTVKPLAPKLAEPIPPMAPAMAYTTGPSPAAAKEVYSGALRLGVNYSYVPTGARYSNRQIGGENTVHVESDEHHTELTAGYSWFIDDLTEDDRFVWGRGIYAGLTLLSTQEGNNPFRAVHAGLDILALDPGTALTLAFSFRQMSTLRNGVEDGDPLPEGADAPTRNQMGVGISLMLNISPRLISR
ncbi:MAG: hypothetical protein ACE366_23140 [Bradymonadia bacterium]